MSEASPDQRHDPHQVGEQICGGDEARRQLANIVESSDDAIISEDLDGVVVSWNPGAVRLFGYSADELVGRR